jgi:hypothetical protein
MRKLIVLFLVVSLLAVAAPAMAQLGSQDPLGLVTSGAVLPYVGFAGSASFLEVYAPVTGTTLHMFFFDHLCVRQGDSAGIDVTENDIEFLRVDNLGNTPQNGLLTIGTPDVSGFFLQANLAPVHLRMLWVHTSEDFIRVIDPIAISTLDNDSIGGVGVWSPLRTAATFWAPPEGRDFQTSIYFVCPNTNIIGVATAATTTRAFFSTTPPIPGSAPPLIPAPQPAGQTTELLIRVYDDEENFLRDIRTRCNCFTLAPLATLSNIYSQAGLAAGTFSEVTGGTTEGTPAVCSATSTVTLRTTGVKNSGNPCNFAPASPDQILPNGACPTCTAQFELITPAVVVGGPFSFTGYRSVVTGPRDLWNRLNNGCFQAIGGTPDCPIEPPNFGR